MENKPLILNTKDAISRLGNDIEIYKTVLQTYITTYPNSIYQDAELSQIFDISPKEILKNETIRKITHKLKGASLTAGADLLGNTVSQIEQMIKDPINGTPQKEETITKLIQALPEIYKTTQIQIKKFIEDN